ncbi:helix-turn-helix transcriptional regulator [Acidovorax sp. sic0104]|uniref:helix-turn-helix transcriptional regulator n=1 Tax=Acidovorax sp. sic0104 TaxID=2854784 RepID=UPI001C43B663|nr:helix-turn-helix transcriptional regulator [Acidovorax sp. sic0104]MBV7541973.1 helix-turn-helix transcriptional regulator [Acidovorax sp. sic0104]
MEKQIETTVGQLYDGVLSPQSWHAALDGLCTYIDAVAFHYFTLDTSGARVPESAGNPERTGLTGDRMAEYEQRYAGTDLRMAATLRMPVGAVMLDHEHIGSRDFSRDALYNDWLAPLGLRHTAASMVRAEGSAQDFLSFMRPLDGRAYESKHKAVIEQLMPHINRAAKLRALVGHLSRQAALGLSALDSLPQGMLVMDAHCRIEYANTAVQRCLGPSSPLRSANGRLQCVQSEHQARLQQLVRTACASPGRAGALECRSNHPQMDRLVASVLPLKASHTLASAWQIPMAVVILVVPGALGGLDHRVVGEMLGLSPAEARLALLLTAGKSIKDFAVAEGCSWHTARTHARNLMAKTGCHRQVELVQLVQALQME